MSINIDIISGFLGAGKTTFLKKLIPYMTGKTALIENEFGDIGVDGDMIPDKLPIKEIYAGCICCSLSQDLKRTIKELALEYNPEHILIEPSGVGSLSDIIKVCSNVSQNSGLDIKINNLITIVGLSAFDDYSENFGSFYTDQIQNAHIILLSHFDKVDHEEIEKVISKIGSINITAFILKDNWYSYSGEELVQVLNTIKSCKTAPNEKAAALPANKIFSTFSIHSPRSFSENEIGKVLDSLSNFEYGFILRAKGILKLDNSKSVYFDFTPYHCHWEYMDKVREAKAAFIGCNLNNQKISELFNDISEGQAPHPLQVEVKSY